MGVLYESIIDTYLGVSAKYGYDNDVVYNVPKMSPLIFEVWIEDVVKN